MNWKSTAKHLPKEGTTVLGWWGPANDDGGCYAVATFARPGHWHDPDDDEDDYRTPEYWMPLPLPPSAAQEGK